MLRRPRRRRGGAVLRPGGPGAAAGAAFFYQSKQSCSAIPGVSPPESSQRIDGELTSEVFHSMLSLLRTRVAYLVAQSPQII